MPNPETNMRTTVIAAPSALSGMRDMRTDMESLATVIRQFLLS
jgi:hypothetical protein